MALKDVRRSIKRYHKTHRHMLITSASKRQTKGGTKEVWCFWQTDEDAGKISAGWVYHGKLGSLRQVVLFANWWERHAPRRRK